MEKIKVHNAEVEILNCDEVEKMLNYSDAIMKKTKKYRKPRYLKKFLTFDIETTTILPLSFQIDPEHSTEKPYAYMYCWQMADENNVIMGRTWKEWLKVLEKIRDYYHLNENMRMVIYVHFLSYEFQFFQSFFNITEQFSKDKRKPLVLYGEGFEFRCSYFLSNMSLEKFCENSKLCTFPKLPGKDFDYSKIRTPKTKLTEEELGYCYCDARGLHQCIESLLEEDDITTIPLTSTGYVRRDARKAMNNSFRCRKLFEQSRLNAEQYELLKNIFRGGDTHASRFFSGYRVDNVRSKDIKSSYPFVMLADYFPMGQLIEWKSEKGNEIEFEKLIKKYCVMFEVELYTLNLNKESCDPYIDLGHLLSRSNVREDNGRVLAADYIKIAITEIDWDIIKKNYKYVSYTIGKCYYARRGQLPQELRDVVWNYFIKKCELDGIENKKYEYAKNKNKLNACFGMMVSEIVHSVFYNEKGEWKKLETNIEEGLNSYYESWNNFLCYYWGIYVTAHGRRRLNILRSRVGNDSVYWDTDSLKYIDSWKYEKFFYEYNEEIKKMGLKYVRETDGKEIYLGIFEDEGIYEEFKTLGSKKYIYKQNKKFKLTVAGMSKEGGIKAMEKIAKKNGVDILDVFELGVKMEDIGRTVSFYHDEIEPVIIEVNGEEVETGANVGIVETTYTLGITNEYYELLFINEYGYRIKKGASLWN